MRVQLSRLAGLIVPASALAATAFLPTAPARKRRTRSSSAGRWSSPSTPRFRPTACWIPATSLSGIDVDVANAIGKQLKVPVEFVTVNSPGRIPALLSNRVDMVIAIFSITPERALQVAFSIPYAGQSAVLIAPKTTAIKGPDDLKNLKVGVTRGALEDGALTAMAIPGMQLLRFDDGPSTVQAMLSGQIDAMGGGDYGEIYLRKGSKGEEYEQKFPLRAAHFGIGIRRGNPELLQWLNTFVYALKNTGELDAISKKWRNGAPMIPLPVF